MPSALAVNDFPLMLTCCRGLTAQAAAIFMPVPAPCANVQLPAPPCVMDCRTAVVKTVPSVDPSPWTNTLGKYPDGGVPATADLNRTTAAAEVAEVFVPASVNCDLTPFRMKNVSIASPAEFGANVRCV